MISRTETALGNTGIAVGDTATMRSCIRAVGVMIDGDRDSDRTTLTLLLRAAAVGDEEASTRLGWMYWTGDGVQRSIHKAVEYFMQAGMDHFE